jgi:hypothetical protein
MAETYHSEMTRWRIAVAAAGFVGIAAGAFQPFYWRMFAINRPAMRANLIELPFRQEPGLRRFMNAVRSRTLDCDRIAIMLPAPAWERGYQYGFTRATYLLAPRTTIPLMDANDVPLTPNVALADYVACWHAAPAIPHFATIWRSDDGVLLRRTR